MMVWDKGQGWSGYGKERKAEAVAEWGREKETARDKNSTDD
jgi:hypothetical protein